MQRQLLHLLKYLIDDREVEITFTGSDRNLEFASLEYKMAQMKILQDEKLVKIEGKKVYIKKDELSSYFKST